MVGGMASKRRRRRIIGKLRAAALVGLRSGKSEPLTGAELRVLLERITAEALEDDVPEDINLEA